MYVPAVIAHGVLYEMRKGLNACEAFKVTYERHLSVTVGYPGATAIAHERFRKLLEDSFTYPEITQIIAEYKLVFELSRNYKKEYLDIVSHPDFKPSDVDERILYEIHIRSI